MNTDKTSSIVLIALGSLVFAAIITWLYFLVQTSKSPIEIVASLISIVIPAAALFYSELKRRSIGFFLFSNRINGLIKDHVLTWRLSAKLTGAHLAPSSIDKIVQDFAQANSHQFKVDIKKINQFSTMIFVDPGPTLEISYVLPETFDAEYDGPDTSAPSLKVLIRNYRIS